MPTNASDRTLGLINIWQVFRKLCWEVELLNAMPSKIRIGEFPVDTLHSQDARIYAAINAASTNLALIDWLYHSIRQDQALVTRTQEILNIERIGSDKAFLQSLRKLNKSLNACHQICNANKHFHLISPEQEFRIRVGEVIYHHADGNRDLAVFMHITQNGAGVDGRGTIDDLLAGLVQWWEEKLTEIQLPERGKFFPAK